MADSWHKKTFGFDPAEDLERGLNRLAKRPSTASQLAALRASHRALVEANERLTTIIRSDEVNNATMMAAIHGSPFPKAVSDRNAKWMAESDVALKHARTLEADDGK